MPAIYMSTPYDGQKFSRGTTVTLKASIDQSGLTSAYSAYGVQFYIAGVPLVIAAVTSSWTASTTFTFEYNGDYSIYAKLVNKTSGTYLGYQSGTVTITILATRPDNWSWTSTVSKGATIPNWTNADGKKYCKPLTAKEWNSFLDRIAQFLNYYGLSFTDGSKISDLYVTSNTEMTVEEVEAAAALIDVMNPPTPVPTLPTEGSRITAAYINGLKNSLNSIE